MKINQIIILLQILVFITGNIFLAILIVPIGLILLNTLSIILAIKENKSKTGNLLGIVASFVFLILHKEVIHPDTVPVILAINVAWFIYPVSSIILMIHLRKERKLLHRIQRERDEGRSVIESLGANDMLQDQVYESKRLKQDRL